MARKTSQSAKKDSTATKNEAVAPRRSSRAVTKPETTTTTTVKDASRSRRSSTVAQTVASVADSRSPRGRSTRRGSTSPSDSPPPTRVKSNRRSTGRINYKESDGEEETPAPKYDENFESGEEFEESDSDEKSKRGRGKQTKISPKNQETKKVAKGTRGRRGRPSKKKDEDIKTLEISDDSMEPEIVETKPATSEVKESTSARPSRGRKSKTEVVDVESENKSKPSRRSARSSSSKEETPKKRPSRSIQAKRYNEDDEEEIEEITDSKAEEVDKIDSSHKRKRESSPEETNKRAKKDESEIKEESIKKEEETKEAAEEDKIASEKQAEEPMEVEECDSGIVSQDDTESQGKEKMSVSTDDKVALGTENKTESLLDTKDIAETEKSSPVEKTTELASETKQGNEPSTICNSKESEEMEEKKDNISEQVIPEKKSENQNIATVPAQTMDKPQTTDSMTSESEKSNLSNIISESSKLDTEKDLKNQEAHAKEIHEFKNCESKVESTLLNVATENTVSAAYACSATDNSDSSLNGTEKLCNSVDPSTVSEVPSKNIEQPNTVVPKANGAHDVNDGTNSVQEQCILPGRKYVVNSKLNETILQSLKNKTFGFLSYNLSSDFNVQKEKLLHELHELNSQIICLQQVPKPFFLQVLEPSLDALGYKGVFSQPEDSLKGMATFFKTSHFRLHDRVEISLRQIIDKELETSALDPSSKAAIKSFIKRCGNALLLHLGSVIGTQTVNVLNVQIPPSDLSVHALQVSSLARDVMRINSGTNKPLLIGGEFNISENDASYQLLRDGYLSNDMIDELQRRKDIAVPEKENSSLVDLLWKSFQHPSSSLCSCYSSVLDHELLMTESKKTSSDLLWYSSDSLHTVGVVDIDSKKLCDRHFSLKADVAFLI